jgi:flagellar biosynthesis anti-sigma factor FlgM
MKIDDISQQRNVLTNPSEVNGIRKGDPGSQQTPSEVQRGHETVETRVDLSAASLELSRAGELMEGDLVERSEKVQEIKSLLANGQYAVDARQVADKVLREALSDLFSV